MPSNILMPELSWIEADQALPPVHLAWGPQSPAPGLLAAGQDLIEATRYANAAAAVSVQGYGAVAPLPRTQQVLALLNAA